MTSIFLFVVTTLELISDNYSKKNIRKHFFMFRLMKRLWEEKTTYTLLGMLSLRCWEYPSTDVQGAVKHRSLVSRRE